MAQSDLRNCTVSGNFVNPYVGGGTFLGTLHNSIVYGNWAPFYSDYENYYDSAFDYSCTTPLPSSGAGNLIGPPQFREESELDFRLKPSSPCIDAGILQSATGSVADFEGGPRVVNGRVDMGAYEFHFDGNLRVMLQGPYDTGTHQMRASSSNSLPLTSPYAADCRQVARIPDHVVDWVLIQLQATADATPVFARSAFLRQDGAILDVGGSTNLLLEVSPLTANLLVVSHRNHLTVASAQPLAFTNQSISYSFSTSSARYLGGTNAGVQLESGVWGLTAGDADGDGHITTVDQIIRQQMQGSAGYLQGDFNLDGKVDLTGDGPLVQANLGRTNCLGGGEVILEPSLSLSPPRKTLLSGTDLVFSASGSTNPLTWFLLDNRSGATLASPNSTTASYHAGSASNTIDLIEVWDGSNRFGRARANVISSEEVARAGRAIVIAGQRSSDDSLWPSTDYLSKLAYNTLLYRGFSKENVRFLSPNPSQDVDGNGQLDDIALPTTLANVAATFTNWGANPDRLFIYLVDHGGDSSGRGYFRLNSSEVLTATDLGHWIDAIQTRYSNDVTVVIDCCESGSFLASLKYSGPGKRVVLTACAANEPTYFVAGGLVSFSEAFFSGLMLQLSAGDAFAVAQSAMAGYQTAWMDDTGDGTYTAGVDGSYARKLSVGASFVSGKDTPQIGLVQGSQQLNGGDTVAALWADDVVSMYSIARVWCLVVPPGHKPNPTNPVVSLPELDLSYNPASGRYEADYDGFTEEGVYKLIYYAKDIWDSVSVPQESYVFQSQFKEQMILVAAGPTNDAVWPSVQRLATLACHTAESRRLTKSQIHYLSSAPNDLDGDGTNDVADVPSVASLGHAITAWAAGANKLTVYLLGATTNGLFQLNPSESLPADQLREWLDTFQSTNGSTIVVLDFDGSGSYIPSLAAPSGRERIVMASTTAGAQSLCAAGGAISFSQYLLGGILNGQSLGAAFNSARTAIRNASGLVRQIPQIDDNGNGVPDQKDIDGVVAASRYLGAAFVTGGEPPLIGDVISNATIVSGAPLRLWVTDILDVAGISNVWCVITPPDYHGSGELPRANLTWNVSTSRYEAVCTNFTLLGTYVCTFFAQDNDGVLSSPVQCEVTVTDTYERDDGPALATFFPVGGTEQHIFHSAADEDWVKFYAPTGCVFAVEATQLGTNNDLVLDLYYEQWDGTLSWVDGVDNFGRGVGKTESLLVDLKSGQSGLWPGVYYVRISSADTNLFGPGSEYELRIYEPTGTGGGVITITFGGSGILAYIQVHLTPQVSGAGWRLRGQTAYHTNPTDTETVSQGGSPVIEFKPVVGWDVPLACTVQVTLGATTVIPATYTRSAQLAVVPAGELGFTGLPGGPFNPANITCLLTNSGEGALRWSAIWTNKWLTLSATNGLLAGGARTNITVSINTNANTLVGGGYTSTIGFLNQSNGLGNTTRKASLSVGPGHAPVLLANPRVLTNGSLALTLQGVSNRVYSILGTTNLLNPLTNWAEVLRFTNAGGQIVFTNPPPRSSPQYYRAKEL
jgi:hypothetical protein